MSRFSLRLRLTVAFVLAMALLLTAAGAFLYVRLAATLDEQIDQALRARADDVAALVRRTDSGLSDGRTRLAESEESFAQVLGPDGAVRDATPGFGTAVLDPEELARARRETLVVERDGTRLLATPVETGGESLVVVAGASLEDRDEALDALSAQLLLGGPLLLLLASLAGYALAAASLRPVLRRLESGLERERRFVAEASHELRTPLSSLKTELELALRRPRSADELRAALASAAEETDRLTLLADALLVLARSDEGELRLRLEAVPVRDLLQTVARRFAARASEAGRPLEQEAPRELTVVGDRLRLEQALGNLVDNALRYGAGTVRLEALDEGGSIGLRVSDQGTGFPPDFVPRAFERFSRAGESRARGAAGLGLALVDAIARAHGGSASATNRAGGGAEVTLALRRDRNARRSSSPSQLGP